jgi:hypothetical protein
MMTFADLLEPVARPSECAVVYPWKPETYPDQDRMAITRGGDVLVHLQVLDLKKRRFLLVSDEVQPEYLGLFREVLGRERIKNQPFGMPHLTEVLRRAPKNPATVF